MPSEIGCMPESTVKDLHFTLRLSILLITLPVYDLKGGTSFITTLKLDARLGSRLDCRKCRGK